MGALFMEKERLRLKYDDLQRELGALKQTMSDTAAFKEESERQKELIEKYKSQSTTLQTENIILRQSVDSYNTQKNEISGDTELELDQMDAIKTLVKEKTDILDEY